MKLVNLKLLFCALIVFSIVPVVSFAGTQHSLSTDIIRPADEAQYGGMINLS